jgi:hypothetical protein
MPVPVVAVFAWQAAQALSAAGAIYLSKKSIQDDLDTNWGGTTWLEGNNVAAHDMYLSRVDSWSTAYMASGGAFRNWTAIDKRQAVANAQWAFQSSATAAGYWEEVARFWEDTAPQEMTSVSPAQLAKIQLATGASVTASVGYTEARDLAEPFSLTPKGKAYAAIAAVVVVLLLRR